MNMRVGAAAILIISHHLLIEETTWLHIMITSQWRHIGISNHQEIDCLFNRFHKENVKVSRYWPFVRVPAGYCVFPSHRANNTESVSMSWRHHEWGDCPIKACFSTQKTKQIQHQSIVGAPPCLQLGMTSRYPSSSIHCPTYRGPFCSHGWTLIPAWMCNYVLCKV